MSLMLGKQAAEESPFSEFKSYFHDTLAAPPSYAHYGGRVTVPWNMYGNGPDPDVTIAPPGWEGAGDCVEAFKAHALITGNFDEYGHTVTVPTANQVIEQYCTYQGCTPAQLFADPNTYDNGESMTQSLTQWCSTVEYGVQLGFTAPINPKSQDDIMNGIYLCGGIGVGIQIPKSAQQQFPNEWTYVSGSPIVGGHAIWLTGYTKDYVAVCTWGSLIRASWQFILEYVDEAHALVLPQAVVAKMGPTGLNIAQWEADLHNIS
jgi:hypothetical protein